MKNILSGEFGRLFLLASIILFLTSGCTDLNAPIESDYTPDNYPQTQEQYLAYTGPVYVQLRDQMARAYWFLQELSTDAAVITARGGNWLDGGIYMQLSNHSWNDQHGFVVSSWQWAYSGISVCNRVLSGLNVSPEGAFKTQTMAEIKAVRALFYFFLMDSFGNVPIIKEYGSTELQPNSNRKTVFTFIEKEINTALPNLSDEVSTATYGKPTKWMANALLAKMYLNAEVYAGEQMYTKAIEACNAIINSGKGYALTPNYMDIFGIKNGPQIKEIIFAVPYDGNLATGQYLARYALHPALKDKYKLPFNPSNASSTWPEFYSLYNEASDKRKQMWLSGKQYLSDGTTPVIIKTTKKGLDASYTGTDANDAVNYQLEFTPSVTFVDPAKFEVGGDELGKAKGIRNLKYFPDNTVPGRDQGNDFVVFRYADILLMKAEALLRGGTDTQLGQSPADLVKLVRERAGLTSPGALDLNFLFQERSREMAWEGWRRNDLIRFGKWENTWGIKTNSESYRRVFPIPFNELALNIKLIQNEGY